MSPRDALNYDGGTYEMLQITKGDSWNGLNYDGDSRDGLNNDGGSRDGLNYDGDSRDGLNYDGGSRDGLNYDGGFTRWSELRYVSSGNTSRSRLRSA